MSYEGEIWHDRGFLPHCDHESYTQFITYRLDDALPPALRREIDRERREQARSSRLLDSYLDSGYGRCLLAIPENAELVVENWRYFNERRYLLHAWCVMPNHVHVLIEPLGNFSVAEIVHSWKSYTGKRLLSNERVIATPMPRRVWQTEYFDRFIRSDKHHAATVSYIHNNPVKAGLVLKKEDWRWSSARENCNRVNPEE